MPAPRTKRGLPVNHKYVAMDPTDTHVGVSAYIEKTTGQTVPAETVALVQRLYPLYLKSPEVQKAKEAAEAAKAAEAAAKEAEKKRRLKERLAKIEAQRVKLLADLGQDVALAAVPEPEPVEEFLDSLPDDEPEPEPEPEVAEDGEPEAEEVTFGDGDEDDWDDEDEDEEDF